MMVHDKQADREMKLKKNKTILTNRNRYEMQLLMLNPIVTTG